MKKCSNCDKEKENNYFYSISKSWCKECINKKNKNYFKTLEGKFSKYKAKSKERNISFNLLLDEFKFICSKPCFYCNSNENIGLDRLNNDIGYEYNNVASCCYICNRFKNKLNFEEWILFLNQLYHFNKYNKLRSVEYVYKDKRNYALNRQFNWYIISASRRNKCFSISIDDFKKFRNIPCFYCGTITNVINIDRVHNTIGYIKNNLVSCCKICNNGKGTLGIEEWISHIGKLLIKIELDYIGSF